MKRILGLLLVGGMVLGAAGSSQAQYPYSGGGSYAMPGVPAVGVAYPGSYFPPVGSLPGSYWAPTTYPGSYFPPVGSLPGSYYPGSYWPPVGTMPVYGWY